MNISFVESNNNNSINISHNSILIMGKGDSEYKNLKIIPSHMGKNSKKELLEIKNQNLIIKEDMEDLIVL